MGIDFQTMIVPLDADRMRAIRTDADLWADAVYQPPFCDPWGDEPLPEISRQLVDAFPPGSAWAEYFGDRSFNQAEYLLDPPACRAVRTYAQRERTMPYRIIFGDELFADHAASGQGMRWRCSTAAFLTEAVRWIDALDVNMIRREFSVAEMDALGVYKVHGEEPDDDAFDRVLANVRAFGEHCRSAVARDLDLLVCLY